MWITLLIILVLSPYFLLAALLLIFGLRAAPLTPEEIRDQLSFSEWRLVLGVRKTMRERGAYWRRRLRETLEGEDGR